MSDFYFWTLTSGRVSMSAILAWVDLNAMHLKELLPIHALSTDNIFLTVTNFSVSRLNQAKCNSILSNLHKEA